MIFLWVLSALGCALGDLQGVILAFVVGSGGLCGCFRRAWGSVQALGVASFWPTRLPGVLNEGAAVSWEALCVSRSSFFNGSWFLDAFVGVLQKPLFLRAQRLRLFYRTLSGPPCPRQKPPQEPQDGTPACP